MHRLFTIALLLLISHISWGQEIPCELTNKQQAKIEKAKTEEKKARLLKRYCRNDSIKNAINSKEKIRNNTKAKSSQQVEKLKSGIPFDSTSFNAPIQELAIPKDIALDTSMFKTPISADTLKTASKNRIKEEVTKYSPVENVQIDSIKLDSTHVTTAKNHVTSMAEDKLNNTKELQELNQKKGSTIMEPDVLGDQKSELGEFNDIDQKTDIINNLPSIDKSKLEKFSGNIESAQEQLNNLKKKYNKVPDLNNLEDAEKVNSLKGKSFFRRLVIGGKFQIQNLDPVVLDASPSIGYRFNKLFIAGIGGLWRSSFNGGSQVRIPTSSIGYKAFVSHSLFKSFFGYSEYEKQGISHLDPVTDKVELQWYPAWHIGLGRKISLGKIINAQVLVLYNLIHDFQNPLYPDRWNFKLGFDLSTEHLIKKKD